MPCDVCMSVFAWFLELIILFITLASCTLQGGSKTGVAYSESINNPVSL